MDLRYEVLNLIADQGLCMVIFTAEKGTPSHDALALLGTLAAGRDPRKDSARGIATNQ